MGNVIDLNKVRRQKKRVFLEKNQALLKQFLENFMNSHFKMSFALVNDQYLAHRVLENETAWDYHDFRDELIEAIAKVYGQKIWEEVQTLPWFDRQVLSPDDLIEHCMLYYIMAETPAANS